MHRTVPLLAAFLALPAAVAGQTADYAFESHLDLQYSEASRDARRNRLDLYLPQSKGPHPLVVFAHGGAWTVGSKEQHAFAGHYFAHHGFATAVVNYRLNPFARWPAFAEDFAAACAFLAEHAAEYQLDVGRTFLVGHSAGGQIAGVVAYDPGWLHRAGKHRLRIRGFVGLSGAYDVRPPIPQLVRIFGDIQSERALASPMVLADAQAPPSLLCWASHDMLKLDACGRMLAARLRGLGAAVQTAQFAGSHVSYLFALGQRQDQLGQKLLQFLREHCTDEAPIVSTDGTAVAAAVAVREVELNAPEGSAPATLFLPTVATHRHTIMLACPSEFCRALQAAARACAGGGTPVAIVPCDAGKESAPRVALACADVARRADELQLSGRTVLAGCEAAAVTALELATDPAWLSALQLDRAALVAVLALCPVSVDATAIERVQAAADRKSPPIVIVHGESQAAAVASIERALTGRIADLTLLPLGPFDLAQWIATAATAADLVTPLLIGFAGD